MLFRHCEFSPYCSERHHCSSPWARLAAFTPGDYSQCSHTSLYSTFAFDFSVGKWSILFPRTLFGHLGKWKSELRALGSGQQWTVTGTQTTHSVRVSPLTSLVPDVSLGSNHNKAKMSSFSVKARPQLQGHEAWSERLSSCGKQGWREKCQVRGAKEGPVGSSHVWLQRRGQPRKPQQQGKNRLTLSDSFSSWIGQISPLLAIWLRINSSDTRLNSLK